jgi:multiple sugar transport system substrate-binding protein
VTLEPRIGAGFRYAANIWKHLWGNGAAACSTTFIEGRCAIGLAPPGCWKQVFQEGVKRVDANRDVVWQPIMKSGEYAEPYQFKPFGSTLVVDRSTGEMVNCTRKLCPKAEFIPKRGHHGDDDRARVLPESPLHGQLINRAPFFWSGGLGTAIRKSSEEVKKDLLWDFFTYTNSPATSVTDLTAYPSWLDAWRSSQLSPGDNYLGTNWSKSAYKEHFEVMNWALSTDVNGAFNLRLPGAAKYTRDVMGTAMDAFIADEIETDEELVAEVVSGWNKVTQEHGKEDQLQLYRASLNLVPL